MSATAPIPSRKQNFRISLLALIAYTALLLMLTAITPDMFVIAFISIPTLVLLPIALAIDIGLAAGRRDFLQFSLQEAYMAITCVAVCLSLLNEPWTFRARFAVSRSALERLAAQAAGGAEILPQRAGLFFIKKATRTGIFTILWTEPDGGSPAGFVHPASDKGQCFNDHSIALRHNPQWSYFIQD